MSNCHDISCRLVFLIRIDSPRAPEKTWRWRACPLKPPVLWCACSSLANCCRSPSPAVPVSRSTDKTFKILFSFLEKRRPYFIYSNLTWLSLIDLCVNECFVNDFWVGLHCYSISITCTYFCLYVQSCVFGWIPNNCHTAFILFWFTSCKVFSLNLIVSWTAHYYCYHSDIWFVVEHLGSECEVHYY